VIVEIGARVFDDAVGYSVAMYEFIQEVEYSIGLGSCDRLDLDLLGELVDGHQYSVESTWCSREWPNHIEPPAGERPGWRYGD
jgi:hypothetical protein